MPSRSPRLVVEVISSLGYEVLCRIRQCPNGLSWYLISNEFGISSISDLIHSNLVYQSGQEAGTCYAIYKITSNGIIEIIKYENNRSA